MVNYSCDKCYKTFTQKSHYNQHQKRKNMCENNADKIKVLIDKAIEDKLNAIIPENIIKEKNDLNITNLSEQQNLLQTQQNALEYFENLHQSQVNSNHSITQKNRELVSAYPEHFEMDTAAAPPTAGAAAPPTAPASASATAPSTAPASATDAAQFYDMIMPPYSAVKTSRSTATCRRSPPAARWP